MNKFDDDDREQSGSQAGSGAGATGIFGTVPDESASASTSSEKPSPQTPFTPVVPATPVAPRSPNIHEIVFHAPGSGTPGHTDSLKRILESSPPPSQPSSVPLPSAPSGGGFTQLLRALSPEDLAPKVAEAAPENPFSVERKVEQAPSAPARPDPVPASQSSPFAQVFAGIDAKPERTQAPPMTPPPQPTASAPGGGGSFTQMFATLSGAAPSQAPTPAADPGATQLFSSVPSEPQPKPAAAPPPAAAAPAGGGFTQVFQALGTKPASEASQPATAPAADVPSAAPANSPGGFTQMFQALEPAAAKPTSSAPPAPASGGFTQMFEALGSTPQKAADIPSPERVAPPPVAAPPVSVAPESAPPFPTPSSAPAPGGITQLLKAFDSGASAPAPFAPSPTIPAVKIDLNEEPKPLATVEESAPAPAAAAPDPGSFTQIFQAAPRGPKPAAAPQPSLSSNAPSSPGGGSFTQLFSTLDKGYSPAAATNQMPEDVDPFARNAPSPTSQPMAAPASPLGSGSNPGNAGSFTQIFSASSAQPKGPASQSDYFPPVAPSGTTPGRFNADGMPPGFSSPQTPIGSGYSSGQSSFSSPAQSPPPSSSSAGGLTQLLRTLDGPGAPLASSSKPAETASAFSGGGGAPTPYSPGAVSPPSSGAPPQSLTQQFSAMNAPPPQPLPASSPDPFGSSGGAATGATTAFKVPSSLQSTPPPAAPSGPGEYTRIIQASQFRESAAQGGSASGSVPSGGAPAQGGGGGHMPVQFTPGSVSMPHMGGASIGGGTLGGGTLGGGAMGGGAMGGGSMGGMHMGGVHGPSMGVPGVHLPSAHIPSAQLKIPGPGGAKPPAVPGAPAAPKGSMTMIIVIIALVLVVAILLAVLLLRK